MNKELAKVLRDRLKGNLAFVDKYGAMVQTVEFKQEQDGGVGIRKRMPVAVESIAEGTCSSLEMQMIPDSSNIGILYFEDGGTLPNGRKNQRYNYVSNLTLICWINRARVLTNSYSEISAMAINAYHYPFIHWAYCPSSNRSSSKYLLNKKTATEMRNCDG